MEISSGFPFSQIFSTAIYCIFSILITLFFRVLFSFSAIFFLLEVLFSIFSRNNFRTELYNSLIIIFLLSPGFSFSHPARLLKFFPCFRVACELFDGLHVKDNV